MEGWEENRHQKGNVRAHRTATCCGVPEALTIPCASSHCPSATDLIQLNDVGDQRHHTGPVGVAQDEAHAGSVLAVQRAHLLQHGQRHVVDEAGVPAHEVQPLARADDAVARGVRLRECLPPQRCAVSGRAPCAWSEQWLDAASAYPCYTLGTNIKQTL